MILIFSQLRPDSHRKKYKTSIKWRNLNPVFNEEFFFETRPNELDKQALTITVWDKDLGIKWCYVINNFIHYNNFSNFKAKVMTS